MKCRRQSDIPCVVMCQEGKSSGKASSTHQRTQVPKLNTALWNEMMTNLPRKVSSMSMCASEDLPPGAADAK